MYAKGRARDGAFICTDLHCTTTFFTSHRPFSASCLRHLPLFMSFSFNLNKKPGLGKPVAAAAAKARPRFRGLDEDDDEADQPDSKASNPSVAIQTFDIGSPDVDDARPAQTRPSIAGSKAPSGPPRPKFSTQHGPGLAARHVQQKQAVAEEAIDPSVYDYDSHYDAIHKAQNDRKAKQAEEAASGKPKYMDHLIAASEQRKRDQTRANDRLLQREREQEGDEFADKEKFVTEAYKAQQAENRLLEEEEKRKEAAEEEKKRKQGMGGFFRSVIADREREHQEALDAAKNMRPGDAAATPADDADRGPTDLERAKALNDKGGNIIITDDGEVADKRQLLGAGLNITARPKPRAAPPSQAREAAAPAPASYAGSADARRAQRERQSRLVEEQLAASQKRAAEESAQELQKREQSLKSAKTSGDISAARAKYLARKKAREEGAG